MKHIRICHYSKVIVYFAFLSLQLYSQFIIFNHVDRDDFRLVAFCLASCQCAFLLKFKGNTKVMTNDIKPHIHI